jgi:hypothetical protein
MRHIIVVAVVLACAMLSACSNLVRSTRTADDVAELRKVVELFRVSIIKKDKPSFMALFLSDKPELITWQSVLDDPSLVWVQKHCCPR